MRDEQDTYLTFVTHLGEQCEYLSPTVGVEAAGGLVGEHETWLGGQRPRDHHTLTLAHRQLLGAL
jgi:hypothetical protein